jgi:bacillithiol system protein YtxJ
MTTSSSVRGLLTLDDTEQLDRIVAASHDRPVVIFKHSPVCGTSAEALDELTTLVTDEEAADVYVIDVLRSRALSQTIAGRFGVRHESPQVLVIHQVQVGWHGSHYRVTVEAIRRALEMAGQ